MNIKHAFVFLGILVLSSVFLAGCNRSPPPTCTDSDGGLDYSIAGTAVLSTGEESIDYCTSSIRILKEYYCMTDIGPISSKQYTCPYACQDGACIPAPVCGDGTCNGDETCITCPADCGQCTYAELLANAVGYWNFDEGTGTIAHDSSPNGNDGIITNATWKTGILGFQRPGGKSLYFNGSADVDMGDQDELDFTGSYSISAWVTTTGKQKSTNPAIAGKGFLEDIDDGYELFINSDAIAYNKFTFQVKCCGSLASNAIGNEIGPINYPHHIVGVRDGATHTTSIYCDGVLVDSDTSVYTTHPNDQRFVVGKAHTGAVGDPATNPFVGQIDEVIVFDSALSAENAMVLFQGS